MNSSKLSQTAARGTVLMVSTQWLKFGIQAVVIVTLSRLLTPGDFGIVAIAIAISGLVTLVGDFGLSYAVLQKKDITRQQHSNAFWISFAFGAALATGLFLLAPTIGDFFHSDATTVVIEALAITAVIYAIGNQYRTVAGRRLSFRLLAAADLSTQIVSSGVAIGLALLGFGFWALVAQQLTLAFLPTIVLLVGTRWLPARPRKADMRQILTFGAHSTGTQLLNYASDNADTLVLGRTASAAVVGSYSRAYQLVLLPLQQIASPLQRVALPVLTRVESPAQFNAAIIAIQRAIGYGLGAVYAAVAVFAELIVLIVLGPQWSETVLLFRLLALIGVFHSLGLIYGWMYFLRDRMSLQFRIVLFTQPVIIALVVVGSNWGATGVAIAMTVGTFLDWILHTLVGLPRLRIPVRGILIAGLRPVLIYSTIAAIVIAMQFSLFSAFSMWERGAASLGLTLLLCGSIFLASRKVRSDLKELIRLTHLLRR